MKKIILSSLILFMFIPLSCKQKGKSNSKNENFIGKSDTIAIPQDSIKKHYLMKAKQIAMNSKKGLGKQLIASLTKDGPVGAMEFCSIEALPITDSLSKANNAHIVRRTDKPRGIGNQANEEELEYITYIQNLLKEGKESTPKIKIQKDSTEAYFPIVTNGMCLQCHGKPNKTILPKTLKVINQLYPQDKATGYDVNELRGIWVIKMKNDILVK